MFRKDLRYGYRENSKNKPQGLYFSKTLFEGLIFGRAYIRRSLSTEWNLRFKIDWASLMVGGKLTLFALFYFLFEDNFPSTSPRGAYIWRGDLTEVFWRGCRFRGLIFGGRSLFSEFYGISFLFVQETLHKDSRFPDLDLIKMFKGDHFSMKGIWKGYFFCQK